MNATLLFAMLVWRGHWGFDRGLMLRLPRLVLAAALMAGGIWLALDQAGAWLQPASGLHEQVVALAALIFGAAVIYFAAAFGTGGASLGTIRRSMRRGNAAPPAVPFDPE